MLKCCPAFLLCWWPYAVILIRGFFLPEDKKTTGRLLYTAVIGGYLNSLINPLLYIALNRDVRGELRNLAMVRRSALRPRETHLLLRARERIWLKLGQNTEVSFSVIVIKISQLYIWGFLPFLILFIYPQARLRSVCYLPCVFNYKLLFTMNN